MAPLPRDSLNRPKETLEGKSLVDSRGRRQQKNMGKAGRRTSELTATRK